MVGLILISLKLRVIPVYVKQLGAEEAKHISTHRSDIKGGDSQLWAEDLRESESFLVCAPRRFIPNSFN